MCRCSFLFMYSAIILPTALSLHDALPISILQRPLAVRLRADDLGATRRRAGIGPVAALRSCCRAGREKAQDRKSTRLNSCHLVISYAVFCLKKKITAIVLRSLERTNNHCM